MIICLDLGATEIKCALATKDEQGNCLVKGPITKVSTNAHLGKQGILNALQTAIRLHLQKGVQGVAIASAGDIDTSKGKIIYATDNLPGMTGFSFTDFCKTYFNLPTQVINDAHAALLGEMTFGIGKNHQNKKVAMLTLGSGVGGGYFANGKIVANEQNDYARFGHLILHPNGNLCTCGKRGCVETYLSGRALHRDAQAQGVDGDDLFALYGESEKHTRFIEDFRKNLQNALSLVNEISPFDVCIIGGGVTNWMGSSFSKVTSNLGYDVVKAELTNDAGIYGAFANFVSKEVL